MSKSKVKAARKIKDLETSADLQTVLPQAIDSIFVKRSRLRKIDLNTQMGVARENGRVYKDLVRGDLTLDQADTRSRILRRQADVLSGIEQVQHLKSIEDQLARINGHSPPGQEFLPGPGTATGDDQ